jgi:hypothetical protein
LPNRLFIKIASLSLVVSIIACSAMLEYCLRLRF